MCNPFLNFVNIKLTFSVFSFPSSFTRARLEDLNSLAADRQAALEESLLSLGEFEEAYDELWTWLADALRQLEEAEPITGDPDAVAAQLARHKVRKRCIVCMIYFIPNA